MRQAGLLWGSAVLLVGLAGCAASAPGPERESAPSSTPSSTSSGSDATASGAPATLSFDDGDSISPAARIEWSDGLIGDAGWTVSMSDDGQGNWEYASADGVCTARFWQGTVTGSSASDDRAASDEILASKLQVAPGDLQGKANDGAFLYQNSGEKDAENRYVVGKEDGRSWFMAARGIHQTHVGFLMTVDCAMDDVSTVANEVLDKNGIWAR